MKKWLDRSIGQSAQILVSDQRGVQAVGAVPEQFAVGARLDDAAAVQHADVVRADHGGQPVGHHDHGAGARSVAHKVVQGGLDPGLALGVEARCRLVQQDEPCPPQDGAGDGQALPLAPAQPDPALADLRVVAQRPEGQNKVVRVRPPAGPVDGGLVRCRLQPVHQIVPHGVRKEFGVLRDDGDAVALLGPCEVMCKDWVPASVSSASRMAKTRWAAAAPRRKPE